jgi:hypothetical protein
VWMVRISEALQAMNDITWAKRQIEMDRKVRRRAWVLGRYISLTSSRSPTFADLFAEDWEIYHEGRSPGQYWALWQYSEGHAAWKVVEVEDGWVWVQGFEAQWHLPGSGQKDRLAPIIKWGPQVERPAWLVDEGKQ